jgi:hypothetical protein
MKWKLKQLVVGVPDGGWFAEMGRVAANAGAILLGAKIFNPFGIKMFSGLFRVFWLRSGPNALFLGCLRFFHVICDHEIVIVSPS